ncbi:MAG: DUF5103 domain-containing protein [Flavobacteriales bacterium]
MHTSPILNKYAMLVLCSAASALLHGQEVLLNQTFRGDIKSVQAYPVGNALGYPLVELGTSDALEFHYDEMTTDLNTHNYTVLHCDHNWHQSDLSANEYLQGFNAQTITEFEAGFNTQIEYVHHTFTFPNDMMKPRYSGNYAVVVYNGNDAEDRSQWLITYRVVVYEQAVGMSINAGGTALIAERYKSQDVDVAIQYEALVINDPQRDVHVTLIQNMDWTTSINQLKPQFVNANTLQYDYNMGENTFKGGAEYHHFETKSIQYSSIEVEHIALEDDGYHAYLRPDMAGADRAYSTQADINGNFLVKNDLADNPHTEADYVWVHFQLQTMEMKELAVFIEGRANQFETQKWTCTYDEKLKAYTCTVLLKQGYYNYRYRTLNLYSKDATLDYTEGNFSNTENDYHAIAYWYDRAKGCDRVIALVADNSVR